MSITDGTGCHHRSGGVNLEPDTHRQSHGTVSTVGLAMARSIPYTDFLRFPPYLGFPESS